MAEIALDLVSACSWTIRHSVYPASLESRVLAVVCHGQARRSLALNTVFGVLLMLSGIVRMAAAYSAEFWTNLIIGVLTLAVGIAVLWITIVQALAAKHREEKEQRRTQEIEDRLRQLTDLMSTGQSLQKKPPSQVGFALGNPEINTWITSVKTWVLDTDQFLTTCTPQASVAFMDDAGSWRQTTVISPAIAIAAQDEYRVLGHRLENLHSILDNYQTYLGG